MSFPYVQIKLRQVAAAALTLSGLVTGAWAQSLPALPISANGAASVTLDGAASPLPVGLPMPVVAIQATAGTDGIHLSSTVGGQAVLPPIDLPGLGALPGLPVGAGGPLAPVTGLIASLTGALGGAAGGGNPLAPISGVVSGVTGALGGAAGGGNPLAPISGVVSGVTGALGGAAGGGNPLAPISGVVSGLTGALAGAGGGVVPLGPLTTVASRL